MSPAEASAPEGRPATSEPTGRPATTEPAVQPEPDVRGRTGGLFASELGLVFRRRRNLVLLLALAAVPVLLGVAVKLASAPHPGEGPPFLDRVTQNGLFLAMTSLVVAIPFFLPLAVAVVAGDSVAGEASLGTLRYLLVAPAGRTRLLLVKFAVLAVFCLAAAAVIAVVGLLTGLALFPVGPVTLLSGTTVGYGTALTRAVLVTGYVAACLATFAAIGLFLSTLTEVPVAAMATALVLAIAAQILDTVPQVAAIHPYLFSHDWFAFGDLLRDPIALSGVRHGLVVQLAYAAVFGSLAWARFTTRDVLD